MRQIMSVQARSRTARSEAWLWRLRQLLISRKNFITEKNQAAISEKILEIAKSCGCVILDLALAFSTIVIICDGLQRSSAFEDISTLVGLHLYYSFSRNILASCILWLFKTRDILYLNAALAA